MANHSSGYDGVMKLSKHRRYILDGITSDWLDIVNACYLIQKNMGIGQDWTADLVTDKLCQIKPGHAYFPRLTHLATKEYRILKVKHVPVGIGKKAEPWYTMIDPNGVELALHKFGYTSP